MYSEKTNARLFIALCIGFLIFVLAWVLMPFFFIVGWVLVVMGLVMAVAAWAILVWRKHRYILGFAAKKEDILYCDTPFLGIHFRLVITKNAVLHGNEACFYFNLRTNEKQIRNIELVEIAANKFALKGSFVIGFGRCYFHHFELPVPSHKKSQILAAIDTIKEILKNPPPIRRPFPQHKINKLIADRDSSGSLDMLEKMKQRIDEAEDKRNEGHAAPPLDS